MSDNNNNSNSLKVKSSRARMRSLSAASSNSSIAAAAAASTSTLTSQQSSSHHNQAIIPMASFSSSTTTTTTSSSSSSLRARSLSQSSMTKSSNRLSIDLNSSTTAVAADLGFLVQQQINYNNKSLSPPSSKASSRSASPIPPYALAASQTAGTINAISLAFANATPPPPLAPSTASSPYEDIYQDDPDQAPPPPVPPLPPQFLLHNQTAAQSKQYQMYQQQYQQYMQQQQQQQQPVVIVGLNPAMRAAQPVTFGASVVIDHPHTHNRPDTPATATTTAMAAPDKSTNFVPMLAVNVVVPTRSSSRMSSTTSTYPSRRPSYSASSTPVTLVPSPSPVTQQFLAHYQQQHSSSKAAAVSELVVRPMTTETPVNGPTANQRRPSMDQHHYLPSSQRTQQRARRPSMPENLGGSNPSGYPMMDKPTLELLLTQNKLPFIGDSNDRHATHLASPPNLVKPSMESLLSRNRRPSFEYVNHNNGNCNGTQSNNSNSNSPRPSYIVEVPMSRSRRPSVSNSSITGNNNYNSSNSPRLANADIMMVNRGRQPSVDYRLLPPSVMDINSNNNLSMQRNRNGSHMSSLSSRPSVDSLPYSSPHMENAASTVPSLPRSIQSSSHGVVMSPSSSTPVPPGDNNNSLGLVNTDATNPLTTAELLKSKLQHPPQDVVLFPFNNNNSQTTILTPSRATSPMTPRAMAPPAPVSQLQSQPHVIVSPPSTPSTSHMNRMTVNTDGMLQEHSHSQRNMILSPTSFHGHMNINTFGIDHSAPSSSTLPRSLSTTTRRDHHHQHHHDDDNNMPSPPSSPVTRGRGRGRSLDIRRLFGKLKHKDEHEHDEYEYEIYELHDEEDVHERWRETEEEREEHEEGDSSRRGGGFGNGIRQRVAKARLLQVVGGGILNRKNGKRSPSYDSSSSKIATPPPPNTQHLSQRHQHELDIMNPLSLSASASTKSKSPKGSLFSAFVKKEKEPPQPPPPLSP